MRIVLKNLLKFPFIYLSSTPENGGRGRDLVDYGLFESSAGLVNLFVYSWQLDGSNPLTHCWNTVALVVGCRCRNCWHRRIIANLLSGLTGRLSFGLAKHLPYRTEDLVKLL